MQIFLHTEVVTYSVLIFVVEYDIINKPINSNLTREVVPVKKKAFFILGIVVVLLVAVALVTSYIDSARVRNSVEPKCTIKIVSEDGNKVTYWGLGYKVVRYPSVSPNEPYKNNRGVKYGGWFMNYELPVGITKEEAVKIAQNDINKIEKTTIINFENPTVEEVVLDEKVSIYLFNADEKIEEKTAYRITFNTEEDGLLGPIVYYVDKDNGKLLGLDYRE